MKIKSTILSLVFEITNSNPGALVATQEIFKCDRMNSLKIFKKLKSIGLTGSKLWVGYKYYKFDAKKFIIGIEKIDPKMIRYVNKMIKAGGCGNSEPIVI